MFTGRLKTNGTAIKSTKETTNNQQKKYNSVKHIERQEFSFTKTIIKVSVKILGLQAKSLSLCFKPAFAVFAFFKDELGARKLLKAFFYNQNYN